MMSPVGRSLRRSCRMVAIIVAAAIGLAACGGGGTGVGDAFAQRAAQVCDRALASKQAWAPFPVEGFDPTDPDPDAFPEVAAWLEEEVRPTFKAWLDDLRALGAPPSGSDAWDDVVAAVQRIARLNADQIAAARDGDAKAFAEATDGLGQTQTQLERATDDAGVPSCADVHA
jgi:hypothetical protein